MVWRFNNPHFVEKRRDGKKVTQRAVLRAKRYSPELAAKPEIVVLSKCDLTGWEETLNSLAQVSDAEVTPFSAVSGQGLDVLLRRVAAALGAEEDDADDW